MAKKILLSTFQWFSRCSESRQLVSSLSTAFGPDNAENCAEVGRLTQRGARFRRLANHAAMVSDSTSALDSLLPSQLFFGPKPIVLGGTVAVAAGFPSRIGQPGDLLVVQGVSRCVLGTWLTDPPHACVLGTFVRL